MLLQANTNAGSKLRQVAFDRAVMRHLGSSLYYERERRYRGSLQIDPDDYSFSENDLVRFFRGERREMEKYIVDAQRDSITHSPDNSILEFVEWSGRGTDRPLSYGSVEGSFFKDLLYKKALTDPLDQTIEIRQREKEQLVRIMSMFAEVFFIDKWDPEVGGRQIESNVAKGKSVQPEHLRAWRIAREEVLANVVHCLREVIEHHYAFTGQRLSKERILHEEIPDKLWEQLRNFLENLAGFPCWIDTNLSNTVFGPKQNLDYWGKVFDKGIAPNGQRILAEGIDIPRMIQSLRES